MKSTESSLNYARQYDFFLILQAANKEMNSDSKKYDAFLSHSSKDRAYAELVCQALESHSLRCWIAPRDILPGAEWGAAIIDGIDQSSVMLLIFSRNANESAQVRREVERAISNPFPFCPIESKRRFPKAR